MQKECLCIQIIIIQCFSSNTMTTELPDMFENERLNLKSGHFLKEAKKCVLPNDVVIKFLLSLA